MISDKDLDAEVLKIHAQLQSYRDKQLTAFVTSSFQTHSIPLLHILSSFDKNFPIYFLNTGFHFTETLNFRDEIAQKLQLNVINAFSEIPKIQQRNAQGLFYYTSDPNYCCHMNKVEPTNNILKNYHVWVNGVRADQNANRKQMLVEQKTPNGKLRYHPILHFTKPMIFRYIARFNLPKHPLDNAGYESIGCAPCTQKPNNNHRDGRWFGQQKTECGLHTDLISSEK